MKIAYGILPVSVLLTWGFVASSGCGSSKGAADAGDDGPACQPACVDARDEFSGDVHFPVDAGGDGPVDGGASCTTYCGIIENFKGCPDPGCLDACNRTLIACTTTGGYAEFEDLLACEIGATYTCSTASPPLPVTSACASQVAAVASACFAEGGSDGGCGETFTTLACLECCKDNHTEGADTYNLALKHCACGGYSPGVCSSPCADSLCSVDTVPEAGSPCAVCLADSLEPDGGCAASVGSDCAADPQCVAYQNCLTVNDCAKK